jgi:2-oxoglutarate ferredoxin oxidoreductase subunit beta
MDVLAMLKAAGATFLARHVSMDGVALVKSLKKAVQNNGFSLVHTVYPCTTNFAKNALGSRNAVNIFRWIRDHASPIGQEKYDTIWSTGIYHDDSNARPEFSDVMRHRVAEIQRGYQDERSY